MWVYVYCYVNPLKKDLYRINATVRVVSIIIFGDTLIRK